MNILWGVVDIALSQYLSFHPVKIITSGEGGIATTNDAVLADCMAELRNHGIVRDQSRFLLPAAGPGLMSSSS